MSKKSDTVLIVGAGVFGLTTALELNARGYESVTVLDRFLPPVPDGSSVDISRVIRADYADPFYAKMGAEAVAGWETCYGSFFHRTGIVIAAQSPHHPYLEQSKLLAKAAGNRIAEFENGNQLKSNYAALDGDLSGLSGYWNEAGGWADAEFAIRALALRCSRAGVGFITGPQGTVSSLVVSHRQVLGVKVQTGAVLFSDRVILATGAWTNRLVNLRGSIISTGQPVGFLQLTPEEAASLADLPVCIDLTSGWFMFPPTPDTHILKVARHGYGYETQFEVPQNPAKNDKTMVSSPKMELTGTRSSFIPDDADAALRQGLALFLPRFKDHAWASRRLCWYSDTPKGNFVVDYHADFTGLFLATGGSGHAFKFLPILGRYVADSFQKIASKEQQGKWAFQPAKQSISKGDGSRGGPSRRHLSATEQSRL